MLVLIIAVLSIGFVISAVSGVSRGIRYLSNTNIVLTIGFAELIFLLGPTLLLLNLVPSGVMEYFNSMMEMMGRSASWGQDTLDFQSAWTVYYWAWWISWSPFVGVFIARISRGRTIRQFILGVIFIPSALLFVAYGVMGGTAISMYRDGKLERRSTRSTGPGALRHGREPAVLAVLAAADHGDPGDLLHHRRGLRLGGDDILTTRG